MPKVPIHQLDLRVKTSVLDVESARGVHPSLTDRIDLIESEVIGARGVGYAVVGDRLDALEALVGTSPRGNLMQTQTVNPAAEQTAVALPSTYDPLASELLVFRNGQVQHVDDDFTLTDAEAIFAHPFFATEYVDFIWFTVPTQNTYLRIDVAEDGSSFSVPSGLSTGVQLLVTVDRLLKTPTIDYTISDSAVTFPAGLTAGQMIEIRGLIYDGRSSGWTVQLVATGGIETVLTPYAYMRGARSLLVFRQGYLLTPEIDYTESDARSITFITPNEAGDQLYIVGSTRAFDRLATLEDRIRQEKAGQYLQDVRIRSLEERLTTPSVRYASGKLAEFSAGDGTVEIDKLLINLSAENSQSLLALPPDPSGTATQQLVLVAGEHLPDASVGEWAAVASTRAIVVPPGGILAGWAVLYR